jgi:hypothetical protein
MKSRVDWLRALAPEWGTGLLLLLLWPVLARAQCGVERLVGSATDGSDQFGLALAADGQWLFVGAPRADLLGSPTGLEGRVVGFERLPQGLQEAVDLSAPSGLTLDGFGASLALSGQRLLVGAPGRDGTFADQGAAYLFELGPGGWQLECELFAPDPAGGDRFGAAVALAGDRLLVGAPDHDFLASNSGAVYVFESLAGQWLATGKLVRNFPASNQRLGSSLAAQPARVAVGAPSANGASAFAGLVEIFELQAGQFAVARTVTSPPLGIGSFFGSSLAVDGERLLIGAPGRNGPIGAGAGSAWSLDLSSPTSSLEPLAPLDPFAGEAFGTAVALSGDVAYVGRPGRTSAGSGQGLPTIGAVDRFERSGGQWLPRARLSPPPVAERPGFGGSLALVGPWLAVGAPEESPGGGFNNFQNGAVYGQDLALVLDELSGCPAELSLLVGGVAEWTARSAVPGAPVVLLVCASGSAPGFSLDGVPVPLQLDALTQALLVGGLPYSGVLGLADGLGEHRASAALPAGGDPSLAGLVLTHATVVFSPLNFGVIAAGGPIALHLQP